MAGRYVVVVASHQRAQRTVPRQRRIDPVNKSVVGQQEASGIGSVAAVGRLLPADGGRGLVDGTLGHRGSSCGVRRMRGISRLVRLWYSAYPLKLRTTRSHHTARSSPFITRANTVQVRS